MGFLDSLFGRTPQDSSGGIDSWPVEHAISGMDVILVYLCEERLGWVPVVGESNYQPALKKLSGRMTDDGFRRPEHEVVLLPEPTNPHDPNAVRVLAEPDQLVGYLSRENAVRYRPAIDVLAQRGFMLGARMLLVGGEVYEEWGDDDDDDNPTVGREDIGAQLMLAEPDDVITQFRAGVGG